MSQTQTTPDTNQVSSETSPAKQTKVRYNLDNSDAVMTRVNKQKMEMMRNAAEAVDYIETSRKMVQYFAADPEYKLDYVVVSGVKVYVEGTVEKNEDKDSESVHVRNQSF